MNLTIKLKFIFNRWLNLLWPVVVLCFAGCSITGRQNPGHYKPGNGESWSGTPPPHPVVTTAAMQRIVAPPHPKLIQLQWQKNDPDPATVGEVWSSTNLQDWQPKTNVTGNTVTLPANQAQEFFRVRNRLGNLVSEWNQ